MLRTILVPLDGSAMAEHALAFATDLAKRADASLRLLHVRTPAQGTPAQRAAADRYSAAGYLAERRASAVQNGVAVTVANREGATVSTIMDEAHTSGADLIVLSSHGRTGPSAAWLGSVADGVARQSDVPVLFVRARANGGARVHEPPRIARMLVPLDGSEQAEQVLGAAVEFARLTGAAMTLLVVDVLPVLIGEEPLEVGTRIGVAEQWRQAESYLEALAPRLRAEGVAVDVSLRANQSAAAAILDEARRVGAGLIAIATHGRSRLRRMFIGSVADKVLRGTDIPVLLVRPADGTSVNPEARMVGQSHA